MFYISLIFSVPATDKGLMRRPPLTSRIILTLVSLGMSLAMSSCGNIFLGITGGKSGSSNFKLDQDSVFNDVQNRCGGSASELSDTKNPFVKEKLKGLPLIVNGKRNDISYKVEVAASVDIESNSSESRSQIGAEITNITASSNGVDMIKEAIDLAIRPEAEASVAKKRGKVRGIPIPVTTTVRLNKEEGPYKGMFCSVGFSNGQTDERGSQKTEIVFDNPLPLALNPKAGLSTYEMELGSTKSFNATVTVNKTKQPELSVGQTVPVTVTVKKISTDIKQLSNMPAGTTFPNINADIAYEVTVVTSSGVSLSKLGLTSRRAFYVNTEAKQFAAIVEFTDKEPGDTEEYPPTILVQE